jgi:hypothetical protein
LFGAGLPACAFFAAIGSVDLAITQFSNSFSNMNTTNLKGFNLMDQVKPRLIIPTHSDNATIQIAVQLWQTKRASEDASLINLG